MTNVINLNTNNKWFGERLKKTREDHLGWTQTELSTLAGISQHQISNFEHSQRMPTLENFKKLCITMNVTADYLLGIVNKPINPRHYMSKVTIDPNSDTFISFDDLMQDFLQKMRKWWCMRCLVLLRREKGTG